MNRPAALPHTAHTIVIAASSPVDVAALQSVLGRYGYDVAPSGTGGTVLRAAQGGDVALVLLDVTLAGSVSLELCRRLCALPVPVPVFLLSATPCDDEHRRALDAGAVAYLALPLQADDVAEKILLQLGVLGPPATWAGDPAMATLEVNYHSILAGSADTVLLLNRDDDRLLDANDSARRLFGLTRIELLQRPLSALCPPLQPDGRSSAAAIATQIGLVLAGEIRPFETVLLHSSGREIACEIRMVALNTEAHRLMHVRIVDISARKLAEALRDGKSAVLEMIAAGAPLGATLEKLMRVIEAQNPDVLCTVLLLAQDGSTVRAGAGPSMPPAFMAAIDGLAIGPAAGSCGTAMYRKETVEVSDIEHDPLWEPYKHIAARHGLRACWATPILHDQHTVLGSFAMYYREVRSPTADDHALIRTATHMAGIAIAATRREEELARHREHLEELVAARTAELRLAKEQAEQASAELGTALDRLGRTRDELARRDRLAALGALVAGVAHELGTPIGNSLTMAGSMSERTLQLRHDLQGGLRRSVLEQYLLHASHADEIVMRNLQRAAGLVSSFRHIAMDAVDAQRRRFALDRLVADMAPALLAGVPAAKAGCVTLLQDVAPGLVLDSYPGQLGQALAQLFENSVLHGFDGRPGGSVTIYARAATDGSGDIALSVSDDGAGVAAAHLPRLYDPFFTTRLGKGSSGLGLYITHNIVVNVLGGRIDAASETGQGSRFTLLLPASAPSPLPLPQE